MARKELGVRTREVLGKKVAALRRAGILPANVYGRRLPSVSLEVDTEVFERMLREAAANEVIDLQIDGERSSRPVIVHHLQRNPLNGSLLHADFYQVSLRDKMRADVPLVVIGTSAAVTTYGGTLLTGAEALHVEALPLDLPGHIEVDVSALKELDTALHVRDLTVPANITVLTDPDVVVARVTSPRVVEEEEEVAAAAAVASAAAAAGAEAEDKPATTAAAAGEASRADSS